MDPDPERGRAYLARDARRTCGGAGTEVDLLVRRWNNLPEKRRAALDWLGRGVWTVGVGASGALATVYSERLTAWVVSWGDPMITWIQANSVALASVVLLALWGLYNELRIRAMRHEKAEADQKEEKRVNAAWTPATSLRIVGAPGHLPTVAHDGSVTFNVIVENIGPKVLQVEDLRFANVTLDGVPHQIARDVTAAPKRAEPKPGAEDKGNCSTFSVKVPLPASARTEKYGLLQLSGGQIEVYDGLPPATTYQIPHVIVVPVKLQA